MKNYLPKSVQLLGIAAVATLLGACEARVNTSPAPGPVVKEETTIVNPPASEKKTETTVTQGPGTTTETTTETKTP